MYAGGGDKSRCIVLLGKMLFNKSLHRQGEILAVRRLGNKRSGSDDTAVMESDPGHNRCAVSDPYVVLYDNGPLPPDPVSASDAVQKTQAPLRHRFVIVVQVDYESYAVCQGAAFPDGNTMAAGVWAEIDPALDFRFHNIAVPVDRQEGKAGQWPGVGGKRQLRIAPQLAGRIDGYGLNHWVPS